MEGSKRLMMYPLLKNGEPVTWRTWPSVVNADLDISVIAPHVWHGTFLYSKNGGGYGFISKNRVVTKPIYYPTFKVINYKYGLVAVQKYGLGINNWVVLSLQGGEEILTGAAAYLLLEKDKLAYRIDGDGHWPYNMKWGLISIPDGNEILSPIAIPFKSYKVEEGYIAVRDRLLAALKR